MREICLSVKRQDWVLHRFWCYVTPWPSFCNPSILEFAYSIYFQCGLGRPRYLFHALCNQHWKASGPFPGWPCCLGGVAKIQFTDGRDRTFITFFFFNATLL